LDYIIQKLFPNLILTFKLYNSKYIFFKIVYRFYKSGEHFSIQKYLIDYVIWNVFKKNKNERHSNHKPMQEKEARSLGYQGEIKWEKK